MDLMVWCGGIDGDMRGTVPVCVFFCLLVFVQFKATLVEVWTLGNVGKVPKVFGGNLGAPTCAGGALGLSGHRT